LVPKLKKSLENIKRRSSILQINQLKRQLSWLRII